MEGGLQGSRVDGGGVNEPVGRPREEQRYVLDPGRDPDDAVVGAERFPQGFRRDALHGHRLPLHDLVADVAAGPGEPAQQALGRLGEEVGLVRIDDEGDGAGLSLEDAMQIGLAEGTDDLDLGQDDGRAGRAVAVAPEGDGSQTILHDDLRAMAQASLGRLSA